MATSVHQQQRVSGRATWLYRASAFVVAVAGIAIAEACTVALDPEPVFNVAFPRPVDSVLVGKTLQVVVALRDRNGTPVTGRLVTYSVDAPAIAEVTPAGLVTGKAAGTAVITATSEGRTGTIAVRVLVRASRVVVAPSTADVIIGQSRQFVAVITGPAGEALTSRSVTWKSTNTAVASPSANGLVTAVALGTITLTATTDFDSTVGSATVNVVDPVANITITPNVAQILRLGATLQLSAQTTNTAGQPVTRPVRWSSTNPTNATVDSLTGLVTAVAIGNATIIAQSEGRSASIGISIVPVPVASVVLSPADTIFLFPQNQRQMSFVAKDSAGNTLSTLGRVVNWQSDNIPVANVSSAGVVTGFQVGAARISVTVDQVRSNETPIKVSLVPVSTVTVSPNGATVRVSNVLQFGAVLRDSVGNPLAGRPITWSVSDTTVASITSTGLLTAIAVGSVQVKGVAEGKEGTAALTIIP
jgi:uncharacterized protein YjdB